MNLNKIPVSKCESIIPNKLYNNLRRYNIKTIGDVKRLDINDFRKLPGIGARAISLLEDFKFRIEFEPEIFGPFYSSEKKVHDASDIDNIPIEKIDYSISDGLTKIFRKYNIRTLEDVEALDMIQLGRLPDIDDSMINELEKLKLAIEFEPATVAGKKQDTGKEIKKPDLDSIKIGHLEALIPNILYNMLEIHRYETVGDVRKINPRKFLRLNGVGYRALEQLSEFQEMIKNEPEEIIKYYQSRPAGENVLENEKIDLEQLKSHIPGPIYNKLSKLRINDITSLMELDRDKIQAMRGVGEKTMKKFDKVIKLIQKKEFKKIEQKEKSIGIIPKTIAPHDLIASFSNLIEDFKDISENEIVKMLINKRFGINDGYKAKLEEIGALTGRTRERVRQIQHVMIDDLRDILSGKTVYNPRCKMRDDLAKEFDKFYRKITKRNFILYADVQKIAGVKNDDENKNRLLRFLMKVWNFKEIEIGKNEFYLLNQNFVKKDIIDLSKNLIEILNEIVIPVSLKDLTQKLKKSANMKIDSALIVELCNVLQIVESFEKRGQTYCQIKFRYLATSKRYAMRMLYETGKPLHHQELIEKVNERLKESGINKSIHKGAITSQMVSDPRFKTVAKTGIWGLSKWDFETSSIKKLMIKALREINKPAKTREIYEQTRGKRDGIKYDTVASYLNHYHKHFLMIKGYRYILKEWQNDYRDVIITMENRKRQPITEKEFNDIILEIYRDSGKDILSAKFLQTELERRKMRIGSSTAYIKLSKCPWLKGILDGNRRLYALREKPVPVETRKKTSRKQILIRELKKIIRSSEGQKCKLHDLVREAGEKTDYSKESIYLIISKHPGFKKERYKGNSKIVSLK